MIGMLGGWILYAIGAIVLFIAGALVCGLVYGIYRLMEEYLGEGMAKFLTVMIVCIAWGVLIIGGLGALMGNFASGAQVGAMIGGIIGLIGFGLLKLNGEL